MRTICIPFCRASDEDFIRCVEKIKLRTSTTYLPEKGPEEITFKVCSLLHTDCKDKIFCCDRFPMLPVFIYRGE